MEEGIPWGWIWFFFAVIAFMVGYFARDDIKKLFKKKPVVTPGGEKIDVPLPPKPSPSSDGGTCVFENEDLILKQVFDYSGKRVRQGTKVSCSDCNQYVFRDEDGCVPYGYDKTENKDNKVGVCTIGGYVPKSCTKNEDCADKAGSRCDSEGFCTKPPWVIPDSKVCPF
jgi:hypothetical protein